uniref:Uncharacterized protein n=1 Tax=Chromera velia CCMP2878 TaxID=1169474 RepID=A0A0K6SAF0_9ALVE|eukprot:Cvel_9436.t1-p1 / transcript=Cvel_9436.t1 / gene=Cvel_9436 / organism=Chromera_velia_CCMP2878 / gene_product=hypothetical protein / transcript_product=hypothetical protein / location=Cvel_scaffold544:30649-33536(+) / protein_length=195 / sequence_SO=supercontig / SO=protein_coding / is_pseudo=false
MRWWTAEAAGEQRKGEGGHPEDEESLPAAAVERGLKRGERKGQQRRHNERLAFKTTPTLRYKANFTARAVASKVAGGLPGYNFYASHSNQWIPPMWDWENKTRLPGDIVEYLFMGPLKPKPAEHCFKRMTRNRLESLLNDKTLKSWTALSNAIKAEYPTTVVNEEATLYMDVLEKQLKLPHTDIDTHCIDGMIDR